MELWKNYDMYLLGSMLLLGYIRYESIRFSYIDGNIYYLENVMGGIMKTYAQYPGELRRNPRGLWQMKKRVWRKTIFGVFFVSAWIPLTKEQTIIAEQQYSKGRTIEFIEGEDPE